LHHTRSHQLGTTFLKRTQVFSFCKIFVGLIVILVLEAFRHLLFVNITFYSSKGEKLFHLNMRKNFFPLRVMEHWNRLPREVVESPSLEIFKTHLEEVLCSLL